MNNLQSPLQSTSCGSQDAADGSPGEGEGEDEESSSRHHYLSQNVESWREEKAKQFFLKGAWAEQAGLMHEAISFYRRALQLVPDIEVRLARSSIWSYAEDESEEEESCNEEESCTDVDDLPLYQRIKLSSSSAPICQMAREQRGTHISDLPREIFLYILRWVISSDIDILSLEQLSRVCKGFYLCARDPELWHLACLRTWGPDCGQLHKFGSWREMYLYRPRLCYNGAYISKTTYVRHGESSFQDSSYRPCFLVEYFRYLRFFPEGKILMLTTPDNPYSSLSKLRYRRPTHSAVLLGQFHLNGSYVSATLRRVNNPGCSNSAITGRHRKRYHHVQEAPEQTFHLELELRSVKGRSNIQLVWRNYAIHTVWRGQETVTRFDLTSATFPSLWFSRVKSFTAESEMPL